MRRVGQTRKRDANEKAIVEALEALGAHVIKISARGAPDLLVAYKGRWTPLEVKCHGGVLTLAQEELQRIAYFHVVETPNEAVALIIKLSAGS